MKKNDRSMEMRFNILQNQYQQEIIAFYQQPAVLDIDEEKEQLQLEIQQLKESIDNMLEYYNLRNELFFENEYYLRFERDLRKQMRLLKEKIEQFNN